MRHKPHNILALSGPAALLLTRCSLLGSDDASGASTEDPVYAEMASWDACEILDYLQPITDYMGIKGYGSSTAEGGEPGNSKIGNTLDPNAIGCGNLIYLGSYDYGLNATGDPALSFTPEERNQWLIETYLPEVNQTVNDRIAEVQ